MSDHFCLFESTAIIITLITGFYNLLINVLYGDLGLFGRFREVLTMVGQ